MTAPTSEPDGILSTAEARRHGAVLLIDRAAIAANWRLLAGRGAAGECAAVVKADAYGLGADQVAPVLWRAGVRTFFVAHLTEAIALRAVLPNARIAVLNGLVPGAQAEYRACSLLPVLNDLGQIERWSDEAKRIGQPLPALIHIDTGMSRLGLDTGELARLVEEPGRLEGIEVAFWMTHLACADEAGNPMTAAQVGRFRDALKRLPNGPTSVANSSGLFRPEAAGFDLARPGCALYGVNPTPEAENPMAGAVRLLVRVLQVREADAGDTIGYGATHRLTRPSRIATLVVGYADGYLRSLSGRGWVAFGNHRAPLLGRVSMDLVTADVTDLPAGAVEAGSWAEVLGPHCPVDAVAEAAGTIGYEILTDLGRRYLRRYTGAEETGAEETGAEEMGAEETGGA